MASQNPEIVEGLSFLAESARKAGNELLASIIEYAVASYEAGEEPPAPAGSTTTVTFPGTAADAEDQAIARATGLRTARALNENDYVAEDGDEETLDAGDPDDAELGATADTEDEQGLIIEDGEDEDEMLAALAAQVDDAIMADATPAAILLLVTGENGFAATPTEALDAVTSVLPSLAETLGAPFTVEYTEATETGFAVTVSADDVAGQRALASLGAGKDGFNAYVPVRDGGVLITSRVADPADPAAAAELGLAPLDLPPVGEGEHEINGALQLVEEATGMRVQAAHVLVSYTRLDGQELSVEQVRDVIYPDPRSQHPTMGLPRFGTLMLLDIEDVEGDPATKVARLGVLDPSTGDVNPATASQTVAALTGVMTVYRGQLPFGHGIGVVRASASVELAEVPMFDDPMQGPDGF